MRDILGERDETVPEKPTRVAEPSRESQLPKRFYSTVEIAEAPVDEEGSEDPGGYIITLDGRPVRTPGRSIVSVKKRAFADVLRTEWDGQVERIDPMTMPMMRLVNTALDGVSVEPQAVKEDIVRFAGTDMLCYRADAPQGLVDRQRLQWDPVLDWAETRLGARFVLAEGVMHVAQPAESIAAFGVHVGGVNDPLELSSLHVVTSLTGSAILAMAVLMGQLNCDEAWTKAHLDEDWNIEQWGRDEEAEARRAHRYKDMQAACLVLEAAA